jgi:hypothetical protein
VVERHAARFSRAGDCAVDLVLDQVGVDQACKAAIVTVMIPHRLAGVRAWGDHHLTVLEIAIIEQYVDREHVVIAVWIECPVLMPLDRRAILR